MEVYSALKKIFLETKKKKKKHKIMSFGESASENRDLWQGYLVCMYVYNKKITRGDTGDSDRFKKKSGFV